MSRSSVIRRVLAKISIESSIQIRIHVGIILVKSVYPLLIHPLDVIARPMLNSAQLFRITYTFSVRTPRVTEILDATLISVLRRCSHSQNRFIVLFRIE